MLIVHTNEQKQALKEIEAKLKIARTALLEAQNIADAYGVNFVWEAENIKDGIYPGNKSEKWQSSDGCSFNFDNGSNDKWMGSEDPNC